MRRNQKLALVLGSIGAVSFSVGWYCDPGASITLVVSLVTGVTAALSQLSTRDLIARAQQLVDRGADEAFYDDGDQFEQAKLMRSRVEKLIIWPIILGVLATTTAVIRTVIQNHVWTSLAFTFGFLALSLSIILWRANYELTRVMDADRHQRAITKGQTNMAKEIASYKPSRKTAPSELKLVGHASQPVRHDPS